MTKKIDQGPIVTKKVININSRKETLLSLMEKLKKIAIILIKNFIFDILKKKTMKTYRNDITKKKFFPKIIPNNGEINSHLNFKDFDRIFRAANSNPYDNTWGKVFIKYNKIKKYIVSYKLLNKKKFNNSKFMCGLNKINTNEFIIRFKDKIVQVKIF